MSSRRSLLATRRLFCRGSLRSQRRRCFSSTRDGGDNNIYDVVCIGGGPAGLSLITALRSNPVTSRLRVALVEAQDLSKIASWSLPPTQFSNRCSSLTPFSARFLESMGAWAHLKRERVQEYQEMQVWDGVTGARIDFDWAEPGQTIAYMVENLNLTSALLRTLQELGAVDVFDKAKLDSIGFGSATDDYDLTEWPVVHLASGKSLTARLLPGSAFAGIESRGWDYDRHGVVATLELEGDGWGGQSRKIAYQRFLPTGPVAMLPLPGKYATLVWSTTPELATILKKLPAKDFIAMVNAAFRLSPVDLDYMHNHPTGLAEELAWRLKHTDVHAQDIPQTVVGLQEGSVASFPLKMRHADTYIGERVALIGDAAHSIHPLAGQGLNQGQGDVESLVRAINYSVNHGQDLGKQLALESYTNERYAANHLLLGVCDKLHKVFGVEQGPIVGLRSLGLTAVQNLLPLKRFFMERASGAGASVS
ncbi:hypothetical protein L249_5883 [Ophiocordyceps polyrhachis-furcata BCC 54312]|uniref:Ubiquinone biosynthesis monooxygenase COQ6, mitochondrial n=1 Tax=Ophiocordyceps polyrhachis-furcata BCC 54312 TaxID=1330021 RepID=A0A367L131_9HYPO|nr:hypothetical protein L249_5883 [Ophiocordyceps polyrhachis-furcata BCC 54312]